MNNKKDKGWPIWAKYRAQFASLQKREKYSTVFVGLFMVIYLGLWFVIFPQQDEVAHIRSEQNAALQELQQINAQLSMLNQALNYDYTKVLRSQIAQTRDELAEINNQGIEWKNNQISTPEMRWIVENTKYRMGILL